MSAKPCIIVDIDGTLAEFDAEKMRDWVLGSEKQWPPFFAFMAQALPNAAIGKLVALLHAGQQSIVICSGRPDGFRHHTEAWLARHNIAYDGLYLRPEGDDHVADEEVKKGLLQQIIADGYQPWLVIDDRQAVVDFWRSAGLTCLQCAPGDF
ncbi:polynucleotide kinase [Raoultella sp. Lac2]|jgi:trehalose-6-phosphatase|uniref:Polynucleotide kinase PNKP phosphatase domain-containing protein n=1 Tax=Klebsiella electrica TaxID=1259973 RepID=A0AAJ5QQT8_9ENTR|nr:polynucleotide kinase [Klebsiella electrica]MXF47557.1 polynucleotide kinase [Raoultella sp. Lac2]MXF98188.1 polynucleotide kinase [Raoultella sp. Lac1]BBV76777.1 hypothetical protein STW0522RAO56_28310 [Raoultella planticola]QDI08985.1 polynucleotide kinase [Klebsiella electrica]WBW59304.1 hypothetical protein OR613_14765 [Klebsiella electrica]